MTDTNGEEHFCIRCGLSDPENQMESLHLWPGNEHEEVYWVHPRCMGEHRGAVQGFEFNNFKAALPEIEAEIARREALKKKP